jgi:hypothetical protein
MIDVDPSVTLGFHRFGPYHRARLNAVRSRLAGLASLEFSSVDEYAWEPVPVEQPAHISLFCDADVNRKPAREVARRVRDALDRLAPAGPRGAGLVASSGAPGPRMVSAQFEVGGADVREYRS